MVFCANGSVGHHQSILRVDAIHCPYLTEPAKGPVVAKKKKPSALKQAAMLRARYRTWLFRMFIGLAICIVMLAIYCALNINGMLVSVDNLGIIPWLAALVAAGVIGYFGNRFSKTHREYEAFLDVHGLTSYEVNEFVKNNQ